MKFDDIQVGTFKNLRKTFTAADIDAFAQLSGDFNPLHTDEDYAKRTSFRKRVAHGMLSGAYVSTLIGMHLPGAGALWLNQQFDFLLPVFIGDEVEFTLRVIHKSPGTQTLTIEVEGKNQHGKSVLRGQGLVMVLDERQPESEVVNKSDVLTGHTALITGGSRGIGAAIARALGQGGASVIINYRQEQASAEQIVAAIRAEGGTAALMQADVADESAVMTMVQNAVQLFGTPVDILVNNASGSVTQADFWDLNWDSVQKHLDIQVRGAFNCCKAVLPQMVERGHGKIINIGSTYSWGVPPAKMTDYVIAKSALHALTRSLAVEFGPKNIQVNMVSPSMTVTDMIADIPERMQKLFAMQTPLRRLAIPEDVAKVVYMLCSPMGDFMNGANIPVSGGSVM